MDYKLAFCSSYIYYVLVVPSALAVIEIPVTIYNRLVGHLSFPARPAEEK